MAASGSYSALERALHHVALGNFAMAETLFDIDQALSRAARRDVTGGRHVFVCGLARAGTTVLLRRLHASGAFRSLTYRDMPFVLAPSLWQRLALRSRRQTVATERAHGDGIRVDADSPESFDEAFWRVFDGPAYIKSDRLVPHAPDKDLVAGYARYVGAVLASSGDVAADRRYLSKNNNNALRLQALARAFPRALFLVPFRRPAAHAASLMRQHQRFVAMQRDDPFVLKYMNWLGHHEFGLGHKPFHADHDEPAGGDPATLDHWLEQWLRMYGWLMETAPPTARFVAYERLCADPAVWDGIVAAARLGPGGHAAEPFVAAGTKPDEHPTPALLERAEALYDAMAHRGAQHTHPCEADSVDA